MTLIDLNQIDEIEPDISVGDSVMINQIEWTVAEIVKDMITLSREEVDGRIQTLDVQRDKLSSLSSR